MDGTLDASYGSRRRGARRSRVEDEVEQNVCHPGRSESMRGGRNMAPLLRAASLLFAAMALGCWGDGVSAVSVHSRVRRAIQPQWAMKQDSRSPFNTAKNGSTLKPPGGNIAAHPAAAMPTIPPPKARQRQQYPSGGQYNNQHYPGAPYPPGQHTHYPPSHYPHGPYRPDPQQNPGGGNFVHPQPALGPMPHQPVSGQQVGNGPSAQNPYYADHHFGASPPGGYQPGAYQPQHTGAGGRPDHGPRGYRSPMPFDPNAPNVSYYVFSQIWPNGHCMTAMRSPCQNLNYEADLWTIRGLWPAVARSDRHVSFCRGAALRPFSAQTNGGKTGELKPQFQHNFPTNIVGRTLNRIDAPTLTELQRVWPNLDFSPKPEQKWAREYRRHGVCSPFDTSVYFHTSIDLHHRYNVFRMFEESRVYPDDLYTYRATELHQALIDSLGFRCALYCKRKQIKDSMNSVWVNVLYEVRICLDTDMMPMNCPAFDVRSDLNVLNGMPIPCYNDVLYPNYHYADSQAGKGQKPRQGVYGADAQAGTSQAKGTGQQQGGGNSQAPVIQVRPVIQLPTTFVLPDGRVVQTQPLVAGNPQAGEQAFVVPGQEARQTNPAGRGRINVKLPGRQPAVGGRATDSFRRVRIDHPDVPAHIVVHIPKDMKSGRGTPRAPVLPHDGYHAPTNVQYPAQRPYPSQFVGAQDRSGGIPLADHIYHRGAADSQRSASVVKTRSSTSPAVAAAAAPIVQQPVQKRKGFAPIRKPGAPPSAADHVVTVDAPGGVLPRPRVGHPMAKRVQSMPPGASAPVAVGPAAADQPEVHIYIRQPGQVQASPPQASKPAPPQIITLKKKKPAKTALHSFNSSPPSLIVPSDTPFI